MARQVGSIVFLPLLEKRAIEIAQRSSLLFLDLLFGFKALLLEASHQ